MTRRNEHDIVRYLQETDVERGFPCWVGQSGELEPCKRPATVRVYGLAFCEEHGEEAAVGALEEMHQDAYEFFERFNNPHVPPLGNPLVRHALDHWERAVPEFAAELAATDALEERTEAALLKAYTFRADKVSMVSAAEIARPLRGNEHPYDGWRDERHHIHACMRFAYERGMTYFVEAMEKTRESTSAQAAYALALDRGEHPEVLERAVAGR
jgi:hypothetical protein